MKRWRGKATGLLSVLTLLTLVALLKCNDALAQTENTNGDLPPAFAGRNKEVSLGCGVFLPSNVPNISNLMSLCGGRYAFRIGQTSMLEAELMTGNGSGQSYNFGAFNYRYDVGLEDNIASFYIGPALHYYTGLPAAGATGSSSTINFGVDVGTALWFVISDTVSFRTDLQLNLNPGTELFIALSLVFRFDNSGGGG